jgi:AraC-like DNA-binding protein
MERSTDALPMPASYVKLVFDLLGTTPARRQALLEGTGIAVETIDRLGDEVTLGQRLRQIRNANRIMPAGWGLTVGRYLQPSTHGALGFGAVSAPTLGAAVALLERFAHVRNPSFDVFGNRRGEDYRLVFRPRCELFDEERVPLLETMLMSFQAIIEAVLARDLDRGHLEIVGRPTHAPLYRDHFHVPIRFNADEDAFVIPADLLDRRSPLADPEMYESSKRRLEEQADRLRGDRFVASRVVWLLTAGSDAGLPIETAAKRLGLSPRTLIRRLSDSGISYRKLHDDHRRQRAETLLTHSKLTLAEIAWRLGYEDTSNFSRACRRWFGRTPGAVRKQLHVLVPPRERDPLPNYALERL